MLDEKEVSDLFKELEAPTHLLHLAWDTTPGLYWHSTSNVQWVRATLSLIDAFKAAGGRRFVGVGTCAEYNFTAELCHEDETALSFTTMYGSCKNTLQQLLSAYNQKNVFLPLGRGYFICMDLMNTPYASYLQSFSH